MFWQYCIIHKNTIPNPDVALTNTLPKGKRIIAAKEIVNSYEGYADYAETGELFLIDADGLWCFTPTQGSFFILRISVLEKHLFFAGQGILRIEYEWGYKEGQAKVTV